MRILLGGSLLLLAACSPDAKGVFDQMHTAACAGDPDKFFVHVQEDTLVDNMIKRNTGADAIAASKVLGQDGMRTMVRGSLEDWKSDIRNKGASGDICGWTAASGETIGEQQRLEVRSKAGNKKYMYFAKVGDTLKMVDYQAVDAVASASSASAGPAPSASAQPAPTLTAITVCSKLEAAGVAVECALRDGGDGVSYQLPGLKFQGGKAGVLILHADDDKHYGLFLGIAGQPGKGRTVLRSEKTRTVLLVLADTFPADTNAKTQAVLDAL